MQSFNIKVQKFGVSLRVECAVGAPVSLPELITWPVAVDRRCSFVFFVGTFLLN